MKTIKVYHVDAFTNQTFGGNAAGVVPDAKDLTNEEMQKIARELNLSETAFILPARNNDAHYRIKYYTPTSEIDFCGHATVALSWVLGTEFDWKQKTDELRLETNIGMVPVKWSINNGELESVIMTQVVPQVKEFDIRIDEITRLLGINEKDLDSQYPIKLAYTGNWHLLVPMKTRKAMDEALPLIEELGSMNREHFISTTHLFTFENVDDCELYTRDFAPAVGIAEDPVTGSANGALAGYLVKENIIKLEENLQFKIAQGHSVGRPGTLHIFIDQTEQGPIVRVGGQAVITISGTVFIRN
ncbi:PhzF family phenazine biosynthesis protein [Bacillus sp. 31A1R]|uniref:PhzF family phenazine biosynthesis protein n=1 Tax=Robertmurraya mangrovi TaxID=3098077 RepID=A0ABU5J0S2_9BACI|nr:PhzF family phenazine biosynthesis protein [Bacillus sp. 31A1R]MDZ5473001.1 PhzF family phenazine biosynthesis protein [Bacillus sp. 31A1R]